jgi:hypothetical protein
MEILVDRASNNAKNTTCHYTANSECDHPLDMKPSSGFNVLCGLLQHESELHDFRSSHGVLFASAHVTE